MKLKWKTGEEGKKGSEVSLGEKKKDATHDLAVKKLGKRVETASESFTKREIKTTCQDFFKHRK